MMFSIVYWTSSRLSGILGLSPAYHADLLIAAPKAIQAVLAALGDYYTWKLGQKVYGRGSNEAWALVCSNNSIQSEPVRDSRRMKLMLLLLCWRSLP